MQDWKKWQCDIRVLDAIPFSYLRACDDVSTREDSRTCSGQERGRPALSRLGPKKNEAGLRPRTPLLSERGRPAYLFRAMRKKAVGIHLAMTTSAFGASVRVTDRQLRGRDVCLQGSGVFFLLWPRRVFLDPM